MTRKRFPHPRELARRSRACAGALLTLGVVGLAPRAARAQADISPTMPNMLLLVDTSGSMEYKAGVDTFPTCAPGSASGSEKSRWIDVVETLAGGIPSYRCEKIDRTQASFASSRYGTAGPMNLIPYDYLYPNPYHRPLSGTCAVYPGTIDATNVFNFPATALEYHPYNTVASNCTFPDGTDGLMDAFAQAIRFGLMTFDTSTNGGTGYSGTAPAHATGIAGTWSYIRTGDTATTGMPAGCIDPQPMEVGARNAGAPVWEGRLVGFGVPDPGSSDYLTKKAQIEKVLIATRPYGATPIAGMLEDAYDFFKLESANDPANISQKLGPKDDPWVVGGCRDQYILLLTDGQPNLDLRAQPGEDPADFCQGSPPSGTCPFRTPEETVAALNSGPNPIRTFVVGFALSSFTVGGVSKTCNELADTDYTAPSGLCNQPANLSNVNLQACCTLNRIARVGGRTLSERAMFPTNRQELQRDLGLLFTSLVDVTSRTQPVMSGSTGGEAPAFRFFSSVKPVRFQPWVGVLERQRYTCQSETVGGATRNFARAETISADAGDDFAANVNSGLHRNRTFYSVEGGIGAEPIYSSRTIRPYIAASDPDGVGVYKGVQYSGNDQPSSTFVSGTPAEAMSLAGVCTDLATLDQCRDRHMKWLIGLDNGTTFTRCRTKNTADCYLLGDILHSTPVVVPPPNEYLRDESYTAFKAAKSRRPMVLYTSTNDGFLHAFKVWGTTDDLLTASAVAKVQTKTNNELWAFMPPAVLPLVPSQYPFTHQLLLDGVPVVRDVVATVTGSGAGAVIALERTKDQAQAGAGDWRTILVQSFGAGRGGYFALDVTDPDQLEDYPSTTTMGPRFLWQLTTDEAGGYQLFGKSGGTPLITTLFFDPAGGSNAKEIPVAILPGGRGDVTSPASQCPSVARVWTNIDTDFPARGKVRCYTGADNQAARSLTIVRLDTGELIRTFRQDAAEIVLSNATAQGKLRAKVTAAPLDSPITGQPVAFPAGVGAIADRVYVGDQDGRVWRVNLASTNPASWSMNLFFDAYPATYASDPNFPNAYNHGQPILLPPVVSVDGTGNVTLNVATGDQDALGAAAGMKTFVWSLTEKTNADRTPAASDANWFLPLTGGERVVGPMQLFNSALYFASYSPASGASTACQNGASKVWGMHYLRGLAGPGDTLLVNQGGEAMLPGTPLKQFYTAAVAAGDSNATIFGVTVAQEPTCAGTAVQNAQDYLSYGTHTTINNVTPGRFQLIMHTGTGGTQVDGGTSRIATLDLAPPVSAARVDSWAALVE